MPQAKAKSIWERIGFSGQKTEAAIDLEAEDEKKRKEAEERKKKKSGFLAGRRGMSGKEFEELEKASK